MAEFADAVIKSTAVFTAETLEPIEGVVVVKGKEIIDVVPFEGAEEYIGPRTKVYECGDRLVLPGFNDAHTHFIQNGVMKDADFTLSLEGIMDKAGVCAKIKEFAEAHPENKWVVACDFNYS